jgi:3-polyprenyl-4-hydroxybenzoate decarboxylase/predicted nicotinamide N-methyase
MLSILVEPRTNEELLARLERLAERPIDDRAPIDQALALLVSSGAVVEARPRDPGRSRKGRIVLGVTGAANAIHAPELALALVDRGYEIRAAATDSALRFITPDAIETITHQRLVRGPWDRASPDDVPHIRLAEWADLVLVYPASATTLARIAGGDCSSIVSAVAITTKAKVVLAPSMNPAMLSAPPVARNLDRLRADGFYIVLPAFGHELAVTPSLRTDVLGPAPPVPAILPIVDTLLEGSPARRLTAEAWEQLWATTPADSLPWHLGGLSDAGHRALDALGPGDGRRFLDLGTGDGSAAIQAFQRGYEVAGVDHAPSALARARARAPDLPITWILGDLFAVKAEPFDVVFDRAVLHGLAERERYAETVARLTKPGGVLVIEAQSEASPDRYGVDPIEPAALEHLLAASFDRTGSEPSRIGPSDAAPAGNVVTFRRRT